MALNILTQLKSLTQNQRSAFWASYFGWTLDAFDFFILIVVMGQIANTFNVGLTSITYAVFLTLAMRPVGAFIFGILADKYGRRPILMWNIAFFSAMELLTAFSPTLNWFLFFRLLYGIGMGGEWGVGASLVMETVPTQTRGILSGILQQGYPVGYLLAGIVYRFVFPYTGWRWLFVIGFLPALVVLYIRSKVKESPVWDKQRLSKSRTTNFTKEFIHSALANWKLLLYMALLMMAFNFFSHGSQDLYPSAFLEKQHHVSDTTTANIVIIYNLGALLGGIVFGALSQYIGRRRAIIFAALLTLPIIPFWAFGNSIMQFAIAAFMIQFTVQGAWGVVPAYLNELSPATLRGTFPGFAYQLGNFLAASNATMQAFIALHYGGDYGKSLAIVVGFVAVVLILLAYFGPESNEARLN